MKPFFIKIKNLVPYLVIIAIYFFFVNIEARKDQNGQKGSYRNNGINSKTNDFDTDINDPSLRISIPVIPYKE